MRNKPETAVITASIHYSHISISPFGNHNRRHELGDRFDSCTTPSHLEVHQKPTTPPSILVVLESALKIFVMLLLWLLSLRFLLLQFSTPVTMMIPIVQYRFTRTHLICNIAQTLLLHPFRQSLLSFDPANYPFLYWHSPLRNSSKETVQLHIGPKRQPLMADLRISYCQRTRCRHTVIRCYSLCYSLMHAVLLCITLKHAPSILAKKENGGGSCSRDLLHCHVMFARSKFADLAFGHDLLPYRINSTLQFHEVATNAERLG